MIFRPSKRNEKKSSIKFLFDKCDEYPFKSMVLNFGDPTSLSFVGNDYNTNPPLRDIAILDLHRSRSINIK